MIRLSCALLFVLTMTYLHGQNNLFQVPDSLKSVDSVYLSYWDEPASQAFYDSVPDIFSHHYRTNLKRTWGGIDIGNNGSEIRPQRFEYDTRPGLRMGYNAFAPYRWNFRTLPFFKTAEAHTRLFASQGNSFANSTRSAQDNSHFEGEFSKGFAHNVRAAVFYRRINEDGLFSRDASNHTQFAVRVSQERNKGRLIIAGAFIRNVFNRQEYGGLDNLTYFDQESFTVRSTIPVLQPDAGLRDEGNKLSMGLKYQLAATGGKSGLYMENLLEFEHRKYKYSDQRADLLDSTYSVWSDHPNKLRHAWEQRSWTNDFSLKWSSELFPEIKAGIILSQNNIDDEAGAYNQTFVTLNGGAQFKLRQYIDLQILAQLELIEEVGDFNIEGKAGANWPGVGQLTGRVTLGQQSPERLLERLSFNGMKRYDSEAPSTQYFIVGGTLTIPKAGLSFSADQYVLNQYAYRSPTTLATETADVSSITSLRAESTIQWGPLHTFNAVMFQPTNDEVFTIPDWSTRHILALEGEIFRNNMWFRAGVEARIFYQDKQPVFIPITGEFLPSDIIYDQLTYSVDPFLLVKVDRFTAFVKGERLESVWLERPFLQAQGYPGYDWMFRFGINWRYIN